MAAVWVMLSFALVWAVVAALVMGALRLPRPGLAAAVGLGLWLVIALAVAMPFGWRAGLGDAVLLGVIVGAGVWRAKPGSGRAAARPYRVQFNRWDAIQGVRHVMTTDGLLITVMALIFAVPAVVLPVPLDTDAQGFGYLALTARLHGDLTTLAPFQPQIDYLYAPGFTVLVAYLSERLGTPLHVTQFGAAAVLSLAFLLVIYDFGRELGGLTRARAHVIAVMVGSGLFTAYMDSHYTSIIGLVFGAALLTFVYRLVMGGPRLFNAAGGALMLAALVLTHPDTTIIVGLGYGAWLLLLPVARERPSWRRWLMVAAGVPAAALALVLPWLLSVRHLLGADIESPFVRDVNYWRVVLSAPPELLYHGGGIVLVAAVGAVVGLRGRRHEALLAVGWLLLILDFAAFGLLERALPWLIAPVARYDYPFSIAWHGPIIPYVLLGGLAFDVAWRWVAYRGRPHGDAPTSSGVGANQHVGPLAPRTRRGAQRGVRIMLILAAVAVILAGVFNRQILALSKGRVTFFGAFASHADVAAMSWLRDNTAPDAYLLNFPGPQEGDWVPVIAERRSVYYRPQPFFQRPIGGDPLADTPEQVALRAFWKDPANPANANLLREAGVDYVIVPQVVGNPASFAGHYRWRAPFTNLIDMQSAVSEAAALTLVFDDNGAQVYAVNR